MMRYIYVFVLWSLSVASYAGNVFTTDYAEGSEQRRFAREQASTTEKDVQGAHVAVTNEVWSRFDFSEEEQGFGDIAVAPFGDEVEYKIDAVNYNIYLGEEVKIPFQLYYGEFASNESPEKTNEGALLDPTQGLALQFPIAWRYRGSKVGGFCNFGKMEGYCVAGGDVTVRGVRLNETNDAGEVQESFVFGASASLRASILFPIFKKGGLPGRDGQAGDFSASVGARFYYHNTDDQNLLFGEITDPTGAPVEFKKEFGALTVESEFDIYEHFKVRVEYFYPLANRDVLDDVFKASIVFAPKPK